MTAAELRVLYLLQRAGGQEKHYRLSQQMYRWKKPERERALGDLETLELISSGGTPSHRGKGGRGGLVYWLTDVGRQTVQDLIKRGELLDPDAETRGRKECD